MTVEVPVLDAEVDSVDFVTVAVVVGVDVTVVTVFDSVDVGVEVAEVVGEVVPSHMYKKSKTS